ncbi:class I SAM-dependent methyltransferase [Oryzicola mucosus]|uniref:Class I SAM-dependent methyltransferase n=1 Tax=Oryzicola mucosus TaxID=2767425 RepID=A0A8J6Q3G9_9HYPH|nr:class I SAM-dependent methyltransferase [Oryzicola mucosus]MBD0415475.1 class I SAM-dependent methyltransferase [Oryzicola mucosus]
MKQTESVPSAALGRNEMRRSYDAYFASGLYVSRYPKPNRRCLRLLSAALPKGGRLLDYGAGEGRYCFALAKSHDADVLAVDISAVARSHLTSAAQSEGLGAKVTVCDVGDAAYTREVESGSYDVALLGFGVLGHIAGRSRRLEALIDMRRALKPAGTLVLGVPNAFRRMREQQAECRPMVERGELEPGDIRYRRSVGGNDIALFYHLFTETEIRDDLTAAGFTVEQLTGESLLPESAVTHSSLVGILDDLACAVVPPGLCYGLLVAARPR